MEYNNNVENTTIEWYLDANYTKTVYTLGEYPSYFLPVYGKTVPNEGYGLVIEYGYVKDASGRRHITEVEKRTIPAGDYYTIPTSIKVKKSCYINEVCSYYDGDVEETKVNGVLFNDSSIQIENNKTYVVYQVAEEQESVYDYGTYGMKYYLDANIEWFVLAEYDSYTLEKFTFVKTYDYIETCPSEFETAVDLTYPGVSYNCEITEGDKTVMSFSLTKESIEAGYNDNAGANFVYREFMIVYSWFKSRSKAENYVGQNVIWAREEGKLDSSSYGYYIYDGEIIDN